VLHNISNEISGANSDCSCLIAIVEADGALDKTRRHKKRLLEDSLNQVVKKQKEYEEKMREKGEEPVMFRYARITCI
jgi:hypothetical protein